MSLPQPFLSFIRLKRSGLLALLAALFMPLQLAAQNPGNAGQHHRYKLIDTGTLGGPTSFLAAEGERHLNNGGTLVSQVDTSLPDPYCPPCFPSGPGDAGGDGFLAHTAQWQNGVLTDLGALPGVNDSTPTWISDSGLVAGIGTNGAIDPLTGLAVLRGVLYKRGSVIDLGTFGGNESIANAVNNGGQVVGCAATAVPDPYGSMCSGQGPQQSRAFLWKDGVMQDLGTLGGPDAVAVLVNEKGQVAGFSLTNSTPNDVTGIPTEHPFLWENGTMRDLGTIGGTAVEQINAINSRGQIVGSMNVAGDQSFHPFLWDGQTLKDLGTFGGLWGRANSLSDAGAVVGWACTGESMQCISVHAFLWQRGTMTDLTMSDVGGRGCNDVAFSVNSRTQIVGSSDDCAGNTSAFLWENGSPVDLNTLVISNPSGAQLIEALDINERGEIAAHGVLPNGDLHAFLLIPWSTE
jgi:probable HAF family extracellular repeat protein